MGVIFGYVYLVVNNVTDKKYVGQTTESVARRWSVHCGPRSNCKALSNAIAKYGQQSFSVYEIGAAASIEDLNKLEALYVELYGTPAPRGYNLKDGGGSKGKWSEEVRLKLIASHNSPEVNRKFKEKAIAMWQRPETRQKISNAIRSGLNAPGVKEKRSASAKIAASTPETKLKMSQGQLRRHADPAQRARASEHFKAMRRNELSLRTMLDAHAKAMSDPRFRNKVSEKMKTKWQDPEYREKMREARWGGKRPCEKGK